MRENRVRRMSPSVGYIGFGNKTDAFSKSSKTPFSKIKQIYGDELEKINSVRKIGNLSFNEISKLEKENIRKKIKSEIRKSRIRNLFLFGVSILVVFLIILLALYWFN
ncbi:hypothetical protein H9I45_04485 [Polaribacter haliotis]|uniref:Uncharacterized protein n=1 Tax=Polaribacter haliotis TaxID=1888915 RepID=A0A7L8AI83_9FLAO|nr:hypothetical protein [Polaribacter haliotis]QOD61713.1 hypothetical protein H9I45_04485 [Polaribacter haliotis]